jgi:hypothetical protein
MQNPKGKYARAALGARALACLAGPNALRSGATSQLSGKRRLARLELRFFVRPLQPFLRPDRRDRCASRANLRSPARLASLVNPSL